jgi:hypothetical protein
MMRIEPHDHNDRYVLRYRLLLQALLGRREGLDHGIRHLASMSLQNYQRLDIVKG